MIFASRIRARFPLVVVALLVGISVASAACGRRHRPGPPTIDSFTATPVSLPSNGGLVNFQWSVRGATELSISPAVGAVSGTSATASITLDGNYTLTASNTHGSSSSSIHISVGAPMTVNGVVLFGAPIANASVLALGQASHGVLPAITDTNGRFTLEGVVPPYDLVVSSPAFGPLFFVFRGINRPDPTLADQGVGKIWPITYPEALSGTLAGVPSGPGVVELMSSYSPEGESGSFLADPSNGAWNRNANWTGKDFTTVTLRALEYTTDPGGLAAGFGRYGSGQATITHDGQTVGPIDVPMAPIGSTGVLSGAVTVPPGYDNPSVGLEVDFGGDWQSPDALFLPAKTATNGTFSFHTPSIPSSSIELSAGSAGPNGEQCTVMLRGLGFADTGVQLDVPAGGQTLLPPPNATGVTPNTTFAWTTAPQTVSLLQVQSVGGVQQIAFIYQTEHSGPLPDLSEAGFQLQAGIQYAWHTMELGPAATMDDFTGPLVNSPVLRLCYGNVQSFTTQP